VHCYWSACCKMISWKDSLKSINRVNYS